MAVVVGDKISQCAVVEVDLEEPQRSHSDYHGERGVGPELLYFVSDPV